MGQAEAVQPVSELQSIKFAEQPTHTLNAANLVRGQEPFQPGATPLKDKRRYLAFNMLGVVHSVERETHNIVTVEFHDQSGHPSSHFDDYTKFTIASLGPQGVAYASCSKGMGSTITFKPFETWGASQGDWNVELSHGELVTVLAVCGNPFSNSFNVDAKDTLDGITGNGSIVAATSKNFLRFFSSNGTQTYLINFGDEIVTMSAGKELLLIVHKTSEYIRPGKHVTSRQE